MNSREEDVANAVKKGENEVFDEMREREIRRSNVVMYRVKEHGGERATGGERLEWDRQQCVKICLALKLDLTNDDIKFCRRLGEKGAEARPLVVGLYSEGDKNKILRRARNLKKTTFREATVCQDLTKRQRNEEQDLWKEAEKRNKSLSEEDVSKNLKWPWWGREEKRG